MSDAGNRMRGPELGVLIAWWGWKLGGAIAAIAAATLYCLDPNFLGHGGLVKNDVLMSLVMFGMMYLAWRVGIRATIPRK